LRANLSRLRKSKALTQAAIAQQVGLKLRQYKNLEAGTSNGSVSVWEDLRNILDAPSIDHLLAQEPEDRPA
jgi:transcriptional regulator with XRE-family HTH domain